MMMMRRRIPISSPSYLLSLFQTWPWALVTWGDWNIRYYSSLTSVLYFRACSAHNITEEETESMRLRPRRSWLPSLGSALTAGQQRSDNLLAPCVAKELPVLCGITPDEDGLLHNMVLYKATVCEHLKHAQVYCPKLQLGNVKMESSVSLSNQSHCRIGQ